MEGALPPYGSDGLTQVFTLLREQRGPEDDWRPEACQRVCRAWRRRWQQAVGELQVGVGVWVGVGWQSEG